MNRYMACRGVLTFMAMIIAIWKCIKKGVHLNLAANVCGYTPVNLGKLIKDGILYDIDSIHRITIDHAVEKKEKKWINKEIQT